MSAHLVPTELIDAVEGALSGDRATHLDACSHCREAVAELHDALRAADAAPAAEPSPLFWELSAQRIQAALGAERERRARAGWRPTPARVAIVGGLACVLLAVAIVGWTPAPDDGAPPVAAIAGAGAPADDGAAAMSGEEDDAWVMLAGAGELELDEAIETGLVGAPGLAEHAALDLTTEERAELGRLLRAELAGPSS